MGLWRGSVSRSAWWEAALAKVAKVRCQCGLCRQRGGREGRSREGGRRTNARRRAAVTDCGHSDAVSVVSCRANRPHERGVSSRACKGRKGGMRHLTLPCPAWHTCAHGRGGVCRRAAQQRGETDDDTVTRIGNRVDYSPARHA
jgi:hypothetical protein